MGNPQEKIVKIVDGVNPSLHELTVETLGSKEAAVVELVDASGNQITDFTGNEWVVNAIDDYTTTSVTYICREDKDSNWWFTKIDETGNFAVFTHASVANNPSHANYAAAYAARTGLTYGNYNLTV